MRRQAAPSDAAQRAARHQPAGDDHAPFANRRRASPPSFPSVCPDSAPGSRPPAPACSAPAAGTCPGRKSAPALPAFPSMTATAAPAPNRMYATGWRLMNPSTSAFMMEACGEGSTARRSPGAASPNWNARASITMVRPTATEAAMHAQKLHLLLRGRRRAQPVARLEIRDGLPGNRKRRAHHPRQRHHEEHARGAGEAEAQQHNRRNDDGQHGHAGHRIARGGGDGVGGDAGEEEREHQRQRHARSGSPRATPTGCRDSRHGDAR